MFNYKKNKGKMLKGKVLPISDSTVSHLRNASLFSNNDKAQFRLKVIEFANEYGVKAATDAFNVSRATIYRWKKMLKVKMLKVNNGKLISLIPKSRKPKRLRKMMVDPEIISFIRKTREEHPRIGKEKLKPLLDKYCKERNIKTISISTIGRIIKRYDMRYTPKEIGYHNPSSKWVVNKRLRKNNKVHTNRVKHSPVSSNLGYIEIDTIVKFINGIKRYIQCSGY